MRSGRSGQRPACRSRHLRRRHYASRRPHRRRQRQQKGGKEKARAAGGRNQTARRRLFRRVLRQPPHRRDEHSCRDQSVYGGCRCGAVRHTRRSDCGRAETRHPRPHGGHSARRRAQLFHRRGFHNRKGGTRRAGWKRTATAFLRATKSAREWRWTSLPRRAATSYLPR